ncbi:membrane protein [Desulfocucumis palustris]|uniref:Membrane protein n=1 Tax=Desulfocucumis palustris TaxID=1898651 RepID=A0A2L2X7J4_9FIRM|nr:hypothetical protein [Desulfocucumis palustris]GBF31970.1 membrane protein [Desulfocucumis palustris]
MKCANHSDLEAVDICSSCRQPVCEQCIVSLAGKSYCKTCLEKRMEKIPEVQENKSGFIALLMSMIPGGGYLYLGLMKRGLQTMLLFFGTIFISAAIQMEELTALILPIIYFYTVFDTQQYVKNINRGYPIEDRELFDWGSWENKRSIIGIALIIIGAMALFNNFAHYLIPYRLIKNALPPILIIGVGMYILYLSTGKKEKEENSDGSQTSED